MEELIMHERDFVQIKLEELEQRITILEKKVFDDDAEKDRKDEDE